MRFFIALLLAVSMGVACTTQTTPINPPNPSLPTVVTPNPVPANQTWVFCGKAYEGCEFTGLRDVRFGSSGKWVVKEFYNSINSIGSCRSETFDLTDPNGDGGKVCEVSTHIKTATIPAPITAMGPTVNLTKIPLGSKGFDQMRVMQASSDPSQLPTKHNDGFGGEFRTHCDYSHMSYDDPIVYPNQPGKSHLHTFFGNTRTWAGSSALSIAETGNSTCAGGIANRSAYWVPTLIDTKDGTPLAPEDSIWYYKNGFGGIPASSIKPMPKGLRMIAGNAKSSQDADSEHTSWTCWDTGSISSRSVTTVCPVGDYLVMRVSFPQCWNGKDLDSSDHKSHMSYVLDYGNCPVSHPIALPEISLNVKYLIRDSKATARWRLSSDMYADSIPGGFSAHADWFDGWNEEIKNTWVKNCNTNSFDCHGFLLGDGRTLY
jgi:hypothetical protein